MSAAAVRPGYEHVSKVVAPGRAVPVNGGLLKWYEIATATAPVPAEVAELAREVLPQAAPALAGELGFVILHRCGDDFYFLLLCTWRNENELWETVWAKAGEHEPAFVPWPLAAGHHPTFCVWELGAVCHEQTAWSRYLRSPRRVGDMDAYLGDSYAGPV